MTDEPNERDLDDLVSVSDYGDMGLGLRVQYSSRDLDFGDRDLERAIERKIWRVYDVPEVKAEMHRIRALYSRGQDWGEPDQQSPQGSEYKRIQREVYEMAKGFQVMMTAYWNVENQKKVAKFEALVDKYGSMSDEEIMAIRHAKKASKEDK